MTVPVSRPLATTGGLRDDQLWFKDAVVYQLHVRAFRDSNGDGAGDFRGLVEKLDYLQELGVTALWLLPFYPSPLRDDGYDIADFRSINPAYGTMRDFRQLLRAAHLRGLRVITELVVNHTSDQHSWFQRARSAPPGSRWRNFYVWSDTTERYSDARIIFQDFEASNWAWDRVAGQYYWHRFYSHQPDLNYESADVRRLMTRTLEYWLDLGVDGLRLDAVPYLYEREGTMCENLSETHEFLRQLRAAVDRRFDARMLLAEANQWPEDAAQYFGEGDECHMAFHFPVMPRLFMAVQMEDRFPIIDILQQTPSIPETCQWALFLRNHDELTLEMVTDEERDYMYRVYAYDRQARINLGIRRRLAPLLGNNRAKMELLNGLLLSLPGTPVLYYGDEIGMGDNVYLGDRDGVRTPMQWSADRNAGFSRANPQQLYLPVIIDPEFHFETVNVETQSANPHSLLWWMRRVISLRNRHHVFGRGDIEFLTPDNYRVLAFVRRDENEQILVVANLSRFAQYCELDLSAWRGLVPRELFGHTEFPTIGELPYLVTLGPYAFYWLALEQPRVEITMAGTAGPPSIAVTGRWDQVFTGRPRRALEEAVVGFLDGQRWFAGKGRPMRSVRIRDVIPLTPAGEDKLAAVTMVEVDYLEGEPDTYVLPLAVAEPDQVHRIETEMPGSVVARLDRKGENALLVDGLVDSRFCELLLEALTRKRRLRGDAGAVAVRQAPALRRVLNDQAGPLQPMLFRAEQSNTSVVYGGKLILKVFRRNEEGVNPDFDVGLYLNQHDFENVPAVAGSLEYRRAGSDPRTLAIVHEIVPNEGDAWSYSRDEVGRFYERVLVEARSVADVWWSPDAPELELAARELPEVAHETSEGYIRSAELLGRRTAELHATLARGDGGPAFAPEPFTSLYQRSLYQTQRNLTRRNLRLLRRVQGRLDPSVQELAGRVLAQESELLERFRGLLGRRLTGQRTRYHGDFHLGQALYTGKDFVIIDFEGEPGRSLADRRIKSSPLRDVAGMLRSFDYAAHAGLRDLAERGLVEPESDSYRDLVRWGRMWRSWATAAYLRSYLETARLGAFLPDTDEELGLLLELYVLEKALYELGYELSSRPEWVEIPLAGILHLLEASR
ncbi:MAG: maltose alpha-D-glucosyltransferase [Actinobacteria bacterium]|nr:MAG: maltose alpha-D-glucosyltransferase [Actinomycetota bacterium]